MSDIKVTISRMAKKELCFFDLGEHELFVCPQTQRLFIKTSTTEAVDVATREPKEPCGMHDEVWRVAEVVAYVNP